jgi:Asp-tRNA(Asn)/Glu-tRNA(Gln) amidotransferase C subunit
MATNEFIWRKVSEKDKEEISKKAKSIIDSFSKKLEKIKGEIRESYIIREEFERKEGEGKSLDLDRKIMFGNAPNKNKNFIIGEKKSW